MVSFAPVASPSTSVTRSLCVRRSTFSPLSGPPPSVLWVRIVLQGTVSKRNRGSVEKKSKFVDPICLQKTLIHVHPQPGAFMTETELSLLKASIDQVVDLETTRG